MFLKVQKVPKGPRGTLRSKGYLKVKAKGKKIYLKVKEVHIGQRYPKGTSRSKVSKRYLKVQGIQKVPKGSGIWV